MDIVRLSFTWNAAWPFQVTCVCVCVKVARSQKKKNLSQGALIGNDIHRVADLQSQKK